MDLVGAAVAVFDRFALWAEHRIIAGIDRAYGGHPMYVVDGIPYRNRTVGRKLAPFFADRLRAFFADPRIRGRVWVHSGSRTKAHQGAMYAAYRAGVGNLAANPNAPQGWVFWTNPHWVAKGSWHMAQSGGPAEFVGAGAADLAWSGISVPTLHSVALEHGLRFPVPGEDWHCQAYTTAGIYPTAHPEPDPVEDDMPTVVNCAHRSQHYVVRADGKALKIGDTLAFQMRDAGYRYVDGLPEHVLDFLVDA